MSMDAGVISSSDHFCSTITFNKYSSNENKYSELNLRLEKTTEQNLLKYSDINFFIKDKNTLL